jgi:hypothetical protein
MEIDSAVEFRGGDIILHTDLSSWSRETPGEPRGSAEKCANTSPPIFRP